MDSAALIATTRRRRGLTQRTLAVRAGTSQAAISRIEQGREAPGMERLAQIMLVMGERAELTSAPLAEEITVDGLTPRERLREAASWNLAATRLELAGQEARRAGHPATRRS